MESQLKVPSPDAGTVAILATSAGRSGMGKGKVVRMRYENFGRVVGIATPLFSVSQPGRGFGREEMEAEFLVGW